MNKEKISDCLSYIFFANHCRLCGKVIDRHHQLCSECERGEFRIEGEICPLCGFSKTDCVCKGKKHSYSAICAPYYYQGGAKKAVLRIKYALREENAVYLAQQMADCVKLHFASVEPDEITFVPMTEKQLSEREENQSELLARQVGKILGLPVRKYLVKKFDTKPQHSLKEALRSGNVLGVFDVIPEKNRSQTFTPEGKTVLLCDDVKTTGATLNECAKMLKLNGAKQVICVSAAITKKQVDKNK